LAARLHGARPTDRLTRAQVHDLLEGCATCWRGAVPGRYVLRLALRRRQRPERVLLAIPRRLRSAGPALPPVRHPVRRRPS
jgi:hypothetical protein